MSAATTPSGRDADQLRTPRGYEGWAAEKKASWLWETIERTAHPPAALPPLRLPLQGDTLTSIGIVTRRRELEKALTRTSDLMEPGRPKVIHAFGSVAMIELETDEQSSFTGLFAPPPDGGAIGLIRMSVVGKVVGNVAFTPGFGLKLFIDGEPSADLLAMNHTVGQGRDFDMFSNTMTNDLSEEHQELRTMQKLMAKLFERVSRQPRRLVVTPHTERRRDGSAVDEPSGPRRLVFHPTAESKRIFAGQAGVDFRRVLADAPVGTPLYEIEGVVDPPRPRHGPPRKRTGPTLGVIRTTTRFVSSDGGDRLFFNHVQDPLDRKG